MAEQDLDRNEDATPFKLQKAREKGQVARSADLASTAVFTVAAAYLYWKGWDGLQAQFRQDYALLSAAGRMDGGNASLWWLVAGMLRNAMRALAPFFAALVATAVIANIVQTGPVLAVEPLKADFTRLDPVAGLRRLLSMRTLFDGGRTVVKLLLLALVVYYTLEDLWPRFPQLAAMAPARLAQVLLHDIAAAGLKIALLLCLIALADFAYSRREFARKMRMSKREQKDEHKQREGDPRIRARLRELRREALRRTLAVRKTSGADVLLTNPTHVAVALRYVDGEMASPQMVAKGAGPMAAVMRQIAARHRIPVVQSPPLARALFRGLEVDQHVPPAHFAEVARILVWVFAMRQRRGEAAA